MKKIFFIVVILLMCVAHADINTKKRILILHSYSQEYEWTKLQHDNFVASLGKSFSSPLDISVEYLDTKRLKFSDGYQSFFVRYLQEKYKGYLPDAIYVTDDDALKLFLNHKESLFAAVPVFFSGINNLSLVHTLDPKKFTGIYQTMDIEPNIELIRQFSPQTRDIWIVGDTSTTYMSIEADIKKTIHLFPNYRFHFLSSSTIDDVTARLPYTPKSFVLLTTIGEWKDHYGRNLTPKESIELLNHNPNIILCSMEDAYMVGGVVGGFVTSGVKQGSDAAALVARYLGGESISQIHSIVKSPNVYMFDRQALMRARIVLSEYTARNAIIVHEEKNFFEKYKQPILNGAFISLIGLFVFFLIIYFVSLEKMRILKKLTIEFEDLSLQFSELKEVLTSIEKSFDIGYWEYDCGAETFIGSEGLLKIFRLDGMVKANFDLLLSFIHPKDKKEIQDSITEALHASVSKTIRHKIVCDEGTLKSVVHKIRSLTDEHGKVFKIIGMVQIVNE